MLFSDKSVRLARASISARLMRYLRMMLMESGISPLSRISTKTKSSPEMRVWALFEKMALPFPSSGMSAKSSWVSWLAVPWAKGFCVLDWRRGVRMWPFRRMASWAFLSAMYESSKKSSSLPMMRHMVYIWAASLGAALGST